MVYKSREHLIRQTKVWCGVFASSCINATCTTIWCKQNDNDNNIVNIGDEHDTNNENDDGVDDK